LQRHGGALHPAVVRLVQQALQRDPQKRPATLAELSQMIEALPQGLLAAPVEIASTIEKQAGNAIQRRQRALQDYSPVPVYGSKPPSNRVTAAPGEGHRESIEVPKDRLDERLLNLLGTQEAPPPPMAPQPSARRSESVRATPSRRSSVDDLFEAKTRTPQHGRRVEATASVPESSDAHTSQTPPGHQIIFVPEKPPKRGSLWLVLLALVVSGGAYFTIVSHNKNSASVATRGSATQEDPSLAQAETMPSQEVAPLAATPSQETESQVEAEPAPIEPGSEPQAEEAPPVPARRAPAIRPQRVAPRPPADEESSGAYRPRGI
jgi:hypothetical protein